MRGEGKTWSKKGERDGGRGVDREGGLKRMDIRVE